MTTATIESALSERDSSLERVRGSRPRVRIVMDPAALVAAYGAHRSAAYNVAYRILGDAPAAEDAVHDAFLKLCTGATQFDPARGSMRGLLQTIARHTSIDVIRRRVRRQQTESTYCADATYVMDGPERATEAAEGARHIQRALSALRPDQRSAVEMAYFRGLTCQQIATATAVPVGTVKSRLRLAMRKLALTLAERP